MKKILHVSDNFGGGLVTALQGYVTNSPQHQHYLLAAKRAGYHDGMAWASQLAGQYDLPTSRLKAPAAIRRLYRELQPDWIHLHSSFAGFYGRIAFLPRSRVIYTPHCYAFERRDINHLMRLGYFLTEQFLAFGNATTAAVSPYEAELAQEMLIQQYTVMLPNAPVIPDSAFTARAAHQRGERLRVAMVGRLTPQKDPGFFVATVKLAKSRHLPVDFIWLGGGDDRWQKKLQALGVTVTGWLDHTTMLERLAGCDVYFHTAAWESGPLSVLEAARLGLIMLCRSIAAIDSLPVRPTVKTPQDAADMLERILNGTQPAALGKINHTLNEAYSIATQEDALIDLYGE
jgi:glycosyltransferase involved in cell wall biosynthesis